MDADTSSSQSYQFDQFSMDLVSCESIVRQFEPLAVTPIHDIMLEILRWFALVSPEQAHTAMLVSKQFTAVLTQYKYTLSVKHVIELSHYCSNLPDDMNLSFPALTLSLKCDDEEELEEGANMIESESNYEKTRLALEFCEVEAPYLVMIDYFTRFARSPPLLNEILRNSIVHLTCLESRDEGLNDVHWRDTFTKEMIPSTRHISQPIFQSAKAFGSKIPITSLKVSLATFPNWSISTS
jgi:hypothetical protein